MSVRDMQMHVGSDGINWGYTWAYPAGSPSAKYRIPTYTMTVSGIDDAGNSQRRDFEVFRFGVKQDVDEQPRIVGLADKQAHTIKLWLPEYRVHSAASAEIGAWQVYGNFLVHDGPDDPRSPSASPYATVGCIEVCGVRQFDELNTFLISLSGLSTGTREEKLSSIGKSSRLTIAYEQATRPPLEPA
jgi:hypothetical protein